MLSLFIICSMGLLFAQKRRKCVKIFMKMRLYDIITSLKKNATDFSSECLCTVAIVFRA